jgi:hypothetical protein
MKILVVCDEGNNRSVTVAQHLKYWGHDVLTVGLNRNSAETIDNLTEWADRVILTAEDQVSGYLWDQKGQLWDLGPDVYPRPFNRELMLKVRALMDEHKEEYKP